MRIRTSATSHLLDRRRRPLDQGSTVAALLPLRFDDLYPPPERVQAIASEPPELRWFFISPSLPSRGVCAVYEIVAILTLLTGCCAGLYQASKWAEVRCIGPSCPGTHRRRSICHGSFGPAVVITCSSERCSPARWAQILCPQDYNLCKSQKSLEQKGCST